MDSPVRFAFREASRLAAQDPFQTVATAPDEEPMINNMMHPKETNARLWGKHTPGVDRPRQPPAMNVYGAPAPPNRGAQPRRPTAAPNRGAQPRLLARADVLARALTAAACCGGRRPGGPVGGAPLARVDRRQPRRARKAGAARRSLAPRRETRARGHLAGAALTIGALGAPILHCSEG